MSSKTKTTATKEEARPALVPKLRFPEFRGAEGWTKQPLMNVCNVLQGYGFPEALQGKSAGKYPFCKVSDISRAVAEQGGLLIAATNYVGDDELLKLRAKLIPKGATVFAKIGEALRLNRRAYVLGECLIDNNAVGLKAIDGVADDYFVYLLSQLIDLNKHCGGAVPSVNKSTLEAIEVVVPDRAEQQKIAECLSSVDDLMAAQARKVDALKTHKKGLMQQLFPREGETQPRRRFPEFQRYGDWELTTVGGLVEAGCLFPPKDGNHGNIHPKASDYVAKGIPFIMASDLNGGLIDIESCHFISKDLADTLQKGFAKEGDVLLSHKGTVGEVAVVREIKTPYLMLTPQVTYYRVKDRKTLSNEFLAQLFVGEAFQSNLLEVSGGGTRAYIGITEQAKLRLQLPKDVEEQHRIASCLSSLDALITAETQKLEALKTHKKGLMQQLFPTPEEVEA